ncbi:hypothetical protein E1B28_005772 [Marasmius oreades]|uniref:Uncharacterized protein n=1 Tax=Marasmius oreades TaxID=181124 RepID=A0A9P7S4J5_9AGAR|nr:uncharacterized protein E1B28_005772 [Marasmius oreades]KAG7094972.1 hypothetical protein E1B28_005772 [Marasmius oreades]
MLIGQKSIPYPIQTQIGCHIGTSVESAHRASIPFLIHKRVLKSGSKGLVWIWIALFVYDTILFILTASRTFRYYFQERLVYRVPLLSLMFRDGVMYFGVLALATLSNTLTFYLCGPFMRGGLSSFASCLSVTMMCRLMLNLHATADTGLTTTPGDHRRAQIDSSDTAMEMAGASMTTTNIVFGSVSPDDYTQGEV